MKNILIKMNHGNKKLLINLKLKLNLKMKDNLRSLKINKEVDKSQLEFKQMEEYLHQQFFMFYDFLQDGFIDFAMEFYEDPFEFDINKAKARK